MAHDTPSRCVLITGAATGIGRATARRFALEGWQVVAGDIDTTGLADLVRGLGEARCLGLALDVTDPAQWTAALTTVRQRFGRLDLLVNNAGILISGPFADAPLARHHAVIDVNVKGLLNGCWLAHPLLAATPGAQVINLCSTAAIYGQASLATYSASKFAVRGLTEALSIEWEKDGIRVQDLMPLFVQTAMVQGMDAQSIRRLGVRLTAEDVADQVWHTARARGRGRVHWPVGGMARWLFRLSGSGPQWLERWIARRIAA